MHGLERTLNLAFATHVRRYIVVLSAVVVRLMKCFLWGILCVLGERGTRQQGDIPHRTDVCGHVVQCIYHLFFM